MKDLQRKAAAEKESEKELKSCKQLLEKYEKILKDHNILVESPKRKQSLVAPPPPNVNH